MDIKSFENYLNGLEESNKRTCEKANIEDACAILVSAVYAESSGGDCWGGTTSYSYRRDSAFKEDLESELYSEISFFFESVGINTKFLSYAYNKNGVTTEVEKDILNFNNCVGAIAEDIIFGGCPSETYSDSYDYYGNFSEYKVYSVDIKKVLEKIKDFGFIDESELIQATEKLDIFLKNKIESRLELKTRKAIADLESKISSFDSEKENARIDLEKNIIVTKNKLNNLEKELEKFDERNDKKMRLLKRELKKMKNLVSVDDGVSAGFKNKTKP